MTSELVLRTLEGGSAMDHSVLGLAVMELKFRNIYKYNTIKSMLC